MRISILLTHGFGLGELLLDLLALRLAGGVRGEAATPHEVKELAGDLSQGFFSQEHWVVLELAERHELHNVGVHVPPVLL